MAATAVTAARSGMPWQVRKRTFTAEPPSPFGVTRFAAAAVSCVKNVSQMGRRRSAAARNATAAST
jgi:hypothetical protein